MVQMLFVKAQKTDKPNLSDVHTRFRPDNDLRRCLSSHARPQLRRAMRRRLLQLLQLADLWMSGTRIDTKRHQPIFLYIVCLPIQHLLVIISRIT